MTVGDRTVPYSLVTAIGPGRRRRRRPGASAATGRGRRAADRPQRLGGAGSPRDAGRRARPRVLPLGRRGAAGHRTRDVPRRRRRADARPRRRSSAGAGLSRHHDSDRRVATGIRRFRSTSALVRPQDEDVLGPAIGRRRRRSSRSRRTAAVADAPRPGHVAAAAAVQAPGADLAARPIAPRARRRSRTASTRRAPGFSVVDVRRAESRGVGRRDGLRRVLLVLQFLPDGRRRCCWRRCSSG